MGIQGLLPLLKDIQVKTSISNFKGQTVGIDVYCWLHKGAYGCAKDLVFGKPTRVYIQYVIRRLNMLISHGVTPILVFDGGYLPAKAEKEKERRMKRKEYRARGITALKEGKSQEAFEHFQKCCDITPEMASAVIKECCALNVKCIVAPYEADAQLAYLMKEGITQLTISEDSDLLLYGCHRVLYKMTPDGDGMLVDLRNLSKVRTVQLSSFTFEKFRQMCMLSGCDYLPSIKGMGLVKAYRALRKHSNAYQCIRAFKCDTTYDVPADYTENFRKAEFVFKYQLVFDPRSKTAVRLNAVDSEEVYTVEDMKKIDNDKALQIALGNIDPISYRIFDSRTDFASGPCKEQLKKKTSRVLPEKTTKYKVMSKPLSNLDKDSKKEEKCELIEEQPRYNEAIFKAFKSLKRLRDDDDVESTEKEGKLQKLLLVDGEEFIKKHSPPKQANVLSVFRKTHKFKNPFRQTVESTSPKKIVLSRYFKGVASADAQASDSPSNGLASPPIEIAKTLLNKSFLECLDETNLSLTNAKIPRTKKTVNCSRATFKQSRINLSSSPDSERETRDRIIEEANVVDRKPLSPVASNSTTDEKVDFRVQETIEDDVICSPIEKEKPSSEIFKALCKSKANPVKLGLNKYGNNPVKRNTFLVKSETVSHKDDLSTCSQKLCKSNDINDCVVYLDEEILPRLPKLTDEEVTKYSVKKKIVDSKAKMSACKPIGLSKRYKPLSGSTKHGGLKQIKLSLDKFAFKSNSIARSDQDVACLL